MPSARFPRSNTDKDPDMRDSSSILAVRAGCFDPHTLPPLSFVLLGILRWDRGKKALLGHPDTHKTNTAQGTR
jgi:hypothetical protein